MPAPFTIIALVGAVCAAILGMTLIVALALVVAIFIEALLFYAAGKTYDGLG